MSDAEENSWPAEVVDVVARAIEEDICRPYEWTGEQFEIWWTKDPRNRNHDKRRSQAVSALDALEAAGFHVDVTALSNAPAKTSP